MRPEPFWVQPDPDKPFFAQPKVERLIRRGPRDYFILGRKPDGRLIETRLGALTFRMKGI
jgi:hypothetical protein